MTQSKRASLDDGQPDNKIHFGLFSLDDGQSDNDSFGDSITFPYISAIQLRSKDPEVI